MSFVLGHNQYGKAENRVVRVFRDRDPHELVDYNVSVALSGGQEQPHLTGDNARRCPPTPRRTPSTPSPPRTTAVAQPESFGIRAGPPLRRHVPSRSPGPG